MEKISPNHINRSDLEELYFPFEIKCWNISGSTNWGHPINKFFRPQHQISSIIFSFNTDIYNVFLPLRNMSAETGRRISQGFHLLFPLNVTRQTEKFLNILFPKKRAYSHWWGFGRGSRRPGTRRTCRWRTVERTRGRSMTPPETACNPVSCGGEKTR